MNNQKDSIEFAIFTKEIYLFFRKNPFLIITLLSIGFITGFFSTKLKDIEPIYQTEFMVDLNHPLFDTNFLLKSSNLKKNLNISYLFINKNPRIISGTQNNNFLYISKNNIDKEYIRKIFEDSIKIEVKHIYQYLDQLNNEKIPAPYDNILRIDRDKLSIENLLDRLNIDYGDSKQINTIKNPIHYGLLGLIISIIFCFLIALISIFMKFKK